MSFTRLRSAWEQAPRPTPEGTTLLAVGDVHAHLAHFDALLRVLLEVMRAAVAQGRDTHLVLIGDYIDRGPANLGVLDRVAGLLAGLPSGMHALCGNHDRELIEFIGSREPDPAAFEAWQRKGGDGFLAELGLRPAATPRGLADLVAATRERLGPARLALLGRLGLAWRSGGWLFVHAGIDPRQPLASQQPLDWLTLREPFLAGEGWAHDLAVVHGHTIRGPEVLPHRVAIDSGAYRTGVLSAVEIAGARLRFHAVADRGDLGEFRTLPGARQRRLVKTGTV